MKSSSSEASHPESARRPSPTEAFEKRTRRTFVEAASELGRAIVGGTLGGTGSSKGGRGGSTTSAAASIHRLRDVLERDRAITAAIDMTDVEPAVCVPDRTPRANTHVAPQPGEPPKVCARCGAGEHATASEPSATKKPAAPPKRTASEARKRHDARDSKPKAKAPLRVPPPPPRARAAGFVMDERDDDEELSVHDEPTKVGPPPKFGEPRDERASAVAAAAASAFGSSPAQG